MNNYGFNEEDIEPVPAEPIDSFSTTSDEHNCNHNIAFSDSNNNNTDLSEFDEFSQNVINQVIELIDRGDSYEDIQKGVIDMFPDLDTIKFEDYMQKSIMLASAKGILGR